MLRWVKIILIILIIIVVSGCWDRRELKSIGFVSCTGIDLSPDGKSVIYTSEVVKPRVSEASVSQSGGGVAGQATVQVRGKGETIMEAIRSTTFENSRKLDFTHSLALIISKDVAKKGLMPILDAHLRQRQFREIQWVLVAEGRAEDIIKGKSKMEKSIGITIDNLIKVSGDNSQVNPVNLQQLIEMLLSESGDATLPIIKLSNQRMVLLDNTAVFKKDKLVGELNRKQTRGILWLNGKFKSSVVRLKGPNGKPVDLEVLSQLFTSRPRPVIDEKGLSIKGKMTLNCTLAEQFSETDLTNTKTRKLVEEQMGIATKQEILSALEQAKKLHSDIFGFGDEFHRKYPKQWRKMKKNWDEHFQELSIDINVTAFIHHVGLINKPLANYQKGIDR